VIETIPDVASRKPAAAATMAIAAPMRSQRLMIGLL
jgi:hypothetical protein